MAQHGLRDAGDVVGRAVGIFAWGIGDGAAPALLAAVHEAAFAVGASLADITKGLANYQGIKGRLERRELSGGISLVDDTYNANPQSMEAALRLLAELKGTHRAVAIMGDMGELGKTAEAAHRETGQGGSGRNAGRQGSPFF